MYATNIQSIYQIEIRISFQYAQVFDYDTIALLRVYRYLTLLMCSLNCSDHLKVTTFNVALCRSAVRTK
jgi:hypothetical protein